MPMEKILTKLGLSFGASVAVNEAVNLEPLWTALITFAVSLLTVFTVEGVAWVRAWFTTKKSKLEEKKKYEKKAEEADEVVAIVEAIGKED